MLKPVTVETGTLSQSEFDQLDGMDQARVEDSTRRLLDRYGQAWLERERSRLRDELSFVYGAP